MNKRSLYLFTILFFLVFQLKSQDESFVALNVGGAIPQGDFAKNDSVSGGLGYATSGFMFGFDGAFFPDDYLGIGGTITFVNSNIDEGKYKSDLTRHIHEKYPDLEIPDSIVIGYNLGSWRYINIMIGPQGTIRAGNFNIDLRALGGVSFVFQPQSLFQVFNDEGGTLFSRTRSDKAKAGFGYTLGAGIRYEFHNNYIIRLSADYTGTKVSYETIDEITNDNGDIETSTRRTDYSLSNIQIGIGVAYHFDF
jgi:opacity protein-like surface antigen